MKANIESAFNRNKLAEERILEKEDTLIQITQLEKERHREK